MNKLTLTSDVININKPLLTVKELLNCVNYKYNTLFLDKFWNNIKDDIWLYIDEDMLKYIGYSEIDINSAKRTYLILLKDNFEEQIDYKLLNSKEFLNNPKCVITHLENSNINTHNKVKHLIVSPDCFKQSLMLLKTNKAKEIKKYYIELEKVFKLYLEYQNQYKNQELENHKKELENKNQELENNKKELEEKKTIINEQTKELKNFINIQQKTVKKLEKEEYVYIASNKLNSKNNVFKVGKTLTLNGRLSNFNINSLLDNEFYYTFLTKCNNAKMLECLIHNFLSPFSYKNELFQLHYEPLSKIVKEICIQYDLMTNMVNNYIEENYINDLKLKPIIPNKFEHKNYNVNDDNLLNNIINTEEESKDELKYTEYEIDSINIYKNIYEYNDVKLYICPRNCEFVTKQASIMREHLARVNKCSKLHSESKELNSEYIDYLIKKNNIKFYICKFCNKHFISDSKLNRHLMSQEGCKQEYTCERCKTSFRLQGDYNAHVRNIYCLDKDGNVINNSDVNDNSNINSINSSNSNLTDENYTTIINNGVTLYKCNLCNKLYNTKGNLNSHLNRQIKCNETFKCKKCNREFHTIDNLKKHENQKINCINQKFKCNKCNKFFTSNRNLVKHLKNIKCS
jgi:hypothetical protein